MHQHQHQHHEHIGDCMGLGTGQVLSGGVLWNDLSGQDSIPNCSKYIYLIPLVKSRMFPCTCMQTVPLYLYADCSPVFSEQSLQSRQCKFKAIPQ